MMFDNAPVWRVEGLGTCHHGGFIGWDSRLVGLCINLCVFILCWVLIFFFCVLLIAFVSFCWIGLVFFCES